MGAKESTRRWCCASQLWRKRGAGRGGFRRGGMWLCVPAFVLYCCCLSKQWQKTGSDRTKWEVSWGQDSRSSCDPTGLHRFKVKTNTSSGLKMVVAPSRLFPQGDADWNVIIYVLKFSLAYPKLAGGWNQTHINSIPLWKSIFSSVLCSQSQERVLWLRKLKVDLMLFTSAALKSPFSNKALVCNWFCWQQWFHTEWCGYRWHLLILHTWPGSLLHRIIPRYWEKLCCYRWEGRVITVTFLGIYGTESHMPSACVKPCSKLTWLHLQVICWIGRVAYCIFSFHNCIF